MSKLTKEELFYLKLRTDRKWYIENFLKIKNKASVLVPFKLNHAQNMVMDIVKQCEREKKLKRFIVLKARQMGLSTLFEALIFHDTVNNVFKNSLIIAHEEAASTNLFNMSKLYYEELPEVIRPMKKYANGKVLSFENPTNIDKDKEENPGLRSKITIATAGAGEVGRSATIHNLHACLHKDSLVLLADGNSKRIEDIKIGDKVITSDGFKADVNNKWHIGKRDTYSISTWLSNEVLNVTSEHKILTDSGYKTCSELTNNDYIQVPKISFTNKEKIHKYHLENNNPSGKKFITDIEIPYNYDFGYLVGYYLAEGHVKKQHSTKQESYCNITFTYEKDEVYIEKALKSIHGLYTSRSDKVDNNTNRKRTIIYGKTISHMVNDLCGRVEDKHIPDVVFDTNIDFAKGIIDGLYDGDGSKTKEDRCTLTTVHESFARQIKRLIIACGYGVPSVRYSPNRYRYGTKTKPVYMVDMNGDTFKRYEGEIVDIPNRATKYKIIDGKYYVRVKSIEFYENNDVYDIEVNHTNHNFETPIGIVSNSEVAFFPDASKTMLGLLQSVPDELNTLVVLESTANGVGDYFHDLWQKASRGENEFIPIFLPWFIDPGYTRPFRTESERLQFIAEVDAISIDASGKEIRTYEYELKEKHDLTYEQLNWRRYTIANKCQGDEVLFMQEYPSTPEEAFISTGRPKFSIKSLKKYQTITKEPERGYLMDGENGTVNFVPDKNGYISIWQKPQPDEFYSIGADVAEGLVDGDYSCAVVGNDDFDIVAMWHGHIDPDLFGMELIKLGKFYNDAYIGVENNNHGLTTLSIMKREEYWNLFFTKSYDKIADTITQKLGWTTSARTKPFMIDKLAEFVREMHLGIYSDLIISEMYTYIIEDNGKTNAQTGCHDDTVMATAIMLQLLLEGKGENYTPEVPIEGRTQRRRDVIDPLFEEEEEIEFSV